MKLVKSEIVKKSIPTKKFTIKDDTDKIANVFTKMYDKPLYSCIREIITNAYDEHLKYNIDKPITIELNKNSEYTDCEYELIIRDYGKGLTEEQVEKIYTTYFESSKEKSDIQWGTFGLGSKTPFLLNDTFVVRSFTKHSIDTYLMLLPDEFSIPHYTKIHNQENNTNETGLEVRIQIGQKYNYFDIIEKLYKVVVSLSCPFEFKTNDRYIQSRVNSFKYYIYAVLKHYNIDGEIDVYILGESYNYTMENCIFYSGNIFKFQIDYFPNLIIKPKIGLLRLTANRECADQQDIDNIVERVKQFLINEFKKLEGLKAYNLYVNDDKFLSKEEKITYVLKRIVNYLSNVCIINDENKIFDNLDEETIENEIINIAMNGRKYDSSNTFILKSTLGKLSEFLEVEERNLENAFEVIADKYIRRRFNKYVSVTSNSKSNSKPRNRTSRIIGRIFNRGSDSKFLDETDFEKIKFNGRYEFFEFIDSRIQLHPHVDNCYSTDLLIHYNITYLSDAYRIFKNHFKYTDVLLISRKVYFDIFIPYMKNKYNIYYDFENLIRQSQIYSSSFNKDNPGLVLKFRQICLDDQYYFYYTDSDSIYNTYNHYYNIEAIIFDYLAFDKNINEEERINIVNEIVEKISYKLKKYIPYERLHPYNEMYISYYAINKYTNGSLKNEINDILKEYEGKIYYQLKDVEVLV